MQISKNRRSHPERYEDSPNKSILDWLQFAATAVTSLALLGLSIQQYITAEVRQDHEIVSGYLNQMTQLQLDEQLLHNLPDEQARQLANAATLNTLRQLDGGFLQLGIDKHGKHKGQILKFLYTAGLIGRCEYDSAKLQVGGCQDTSLSLVGAELDNMSFELPIPLHGIDLTGASLIEAKLPEIALTKAKMTDAKLDGAVLRRAVMAGAQMEKVTLVDADLLEAVLPNAQLQGSKLNQADLRGANLYKATLNRAVLIDAKFQGADFSEARLGMADLRNVDLSKVKSLRGADLREAVYNYATKFPEGFDRDQQGMKLCAKPIDQECESLK